MRWLSLEPGLRPCVHSDVSNVVGCHAATHLQEVVGEIFGKDKIGKHVGATLADRLVMDVPGVVAGGLWGGGVGGGVLRTKEDGG